MYFYIFNCPHNNISWFIIIVNHRFGDRFKNIDLSISFLEEIGVKLIQKSSFYETLSQPNKNDPKFINVVISVSSILSPIDLMLSLISIEENLDEKE